VLDVQGTVAQFQAGARDFCHVQNIQTHYGANPSSNSVDNGGPFPWGIAVRARNWPLISIYFQGEE
jgi:hypothetical protein